MQNKSASVLAVEVYVYEVYKTHFIVWQIRHDLDDEKMRIVFS